MTKDFQVASNGNSEHCAAPTPIAIIGMACRFAGGANSPSDLWKLCAEGTDVWSPIPKQRFAGNSWHDPDPHKQGKINVLGGYFLNQDIDKFDAPFFNLSGELASAMDPQMRLLLESAYEAIEDAGISTAKINGSNTSVFTAAFTKDYHEIGTKDSATLPRDFVGGVGTATLSNRISHFFDLRGSSMTIDTGCSGSLVAIHQGVQSIRTGESDMSLIGGVNIMLHQDPFIYIGASGTLGSNGRCYAWDSRAEGYGRGEGVATLLLKPLPAALRDGDRVHAVIRESALNQDGRTHTMWSPSVDAQKALIEACYKRAGLNISDTAYVEAHMTGTLAGDPIEASALAQTFGMSRNAQDPVLVGSVKTIIGHTEAASGLAAVIKTIFALKRGLIPPNLNYEKPNPNIPMSNWHLAVPQTLTRWPKDKIFRASVNNFGYGGTNAHVILERAPIEGQILVGNSNKMVANSEQSLVYVFSAKDSIALERMADRFAAYLRDSLSNHQGIIASDLAYTFWKRRSLFPWRLVIRARNLPELCTKLASKTLKPVHTTKQPRLGFVFNGQGAQWYAMGRELITTYPFYGHRIHKAGQILQQYGATWSLQDELLRDEKSTRLSEVDFSQPISVALQLCLFDLLKAWGITPSAITSHSSGEIAAAYAAGALSFEEALGVAYFRGELALKYQKEFPKRGGMLAAVLDAESGAKYANQIANNQVVVACINSPNSVTFSGDSDALDVLESQLEKDLVPRKRLRVPVAYHSHHMVPMSQEYIEKLQSILSGTGGWENMLFTSPTSGGVITSPDQLSPSHWANNLTSVVQFNEAFTTMCFSPKGSNVDLIVEIGAHNTLEGPIRQIFKTQGIEMPYVSSLKRNTNAVETMQELVGQIICHGYPVAIESVNWPKRDEVDRLEFVPDLPSYPWNHSKLYWNESRIAQDSRFKRFSHHELLGNPLAGSNGSTPTWRNILHLSDIDWLLDHQVGSEVVFPGAGYIAMAIEAVRLINDEPVNKVVHGYRLKDIEILNSLVIPDTANGVEMQFALRPCNKTELTKTGWYHFTVFSLTSGDVWTENCHGLVSIELTDQKMENLYQPKLPCTETFFIGTNDVISHISGMEILNHMRAMGINHGPSFQNLIGSHTANGKTITEFLVNAALLENKPGYALHPTTLDSIFQTAYGCLPQDKMKGVTLLPRSIRTLFIPVGFGQQGSCRMHAYTKLVVAHRRTFSCDIQVLAKEECHVSKLPYFQMGEFTLQSIPRVNVDDDGEELDKICSRLYWEADVLHNVPENIRLEMATKIGGQEAQLDQECIRAAYYFIKDALAQLEGSDTRNWLKHHRRLHRWMQDTIKECKDGQMLPKSQQWSKSSPGIKSMLFDDLWSANSGCRLLIQVGRRLVDIIKGQVEPLELMMESGLLGQYYRDSTVAKRCYQHMGRIVEFYSLKKPGARVLEIGAGTGGATMAVLEAFNAKAHQLGLPGSLLGQYTFTDISPGFFPEARERLAAWQDMIDFQVLDIEGDTATQSLHGQFDLVVASMVLHATKSLRNTLSNVRKLLKPGGKLLFMEATRDRLDMQLIFGTLPGWWLGEHDGRETSPNVSTDIWDRRLREVGFSGIDFEIGDCDDEELRTSTVILSTAIEPDAWHMPISIVHVANDPPPKNWLQSLSQEICARFGTTPCIETLDQIPDQPDNKIRIFISEMTRPIVSDMGQLMFQKIRALLLNSRDVLWLSCGSFADAGDPSFAATQGLLRTLRREESDKLYPHLDFQRDPLQGHDSTDLWSDDQISHIIHILCETFNSTTDPDILDREYAVKGSIIHVARAYPGTTQHHRDGDREPGQVTTLLPFKQHGRPLEWEISNTGSLSEILFVDSKPLSETLPSGVVEVEARAFGLNFRDVMDAMGLVETELVKNEIAGIITRLGPNTEASGLRVGDRVCGVAMGTFASISRAHWMCLTQIPDGMSFETAASIPAVFVTAYHSLVTVARLKRGESVLIHSAAGGVGQAAIVLAQHIGANIYATCGSDAKRDFLVRQFSIGPQRIFSSRNSNFSPAIMEMTEGKGVNVILNSLSGPLLQATWDCIARFGRFIEIGKVDMQGKGRLEMTPFTRCALYASVDVLQLAEYDLPASQDALTQSMNICSQLSTSPISPITAYAISDMDKAMRKMQSGTHTGKLILVPGQHDLVKVITRQKPVSLANVNATYLIVGGIGGIGRAIAEWMIEKGAQHILIISRHATSHPMAGSLKDRGIQTSCKVEIRDCDIVNEASLSHCIRDCLQFMPPIRGLINGAMVLDDSVFERMTFDKWCSAALPKIQGSRNLQKLLPELDFCIMLSSTAGLLGNVSQANYGAGGSFLDAMARHRTRNGQPAVVLDLGVVLSAGHVAEKENAGDYSVRARTDKEGLAQVKLSQLLMLVEDAIRYPLRPSPEESQISMSVTENTVKVWARDGLHQDPRFSTLRLATPRGNVLQGSGTRKDEKAVLAAALTNPVLTLSAARDIIVEALAVKLADMFDIQVSDVDVALPLSHYGVDSLVAVELRKWLGTALRVRQVSVFDILQSTSVCEFGNLLAKKSEYTDSLES